MSSVVGLVVVVWRRVVVVGRTAVPPIVVVVVRSVPVTVAVARVVVGMVIGSVLLDWWSRGIAVVSSTAGREHRCVTCSRRMGVGM